MPTTPPRPQPRVAPTSRHHPILLLPLLHLRALVLVLLIPALFSISSSPLSSPAFPAAQALRVRVDCRAPSQPCTSDLNCSLNGECNASSGSCVCDQGWTGICCESLDFVPVPLSSSYRAPNVSTWGGNIVQNPQDGSFHMWIAEMAPDPETGGSCGLTTWADNSQITHVTSASGSPLGPYVRKEVAVGVWSHNPIVRVDPHNGTLVMWHIGRGDGGSGPPPQGYCHRNGTSPCGEQSFDKCQAPSTLCDQAGFIPGWTCYPAMCSSDGTSSASRGSWRMGNDCGADLAEPSLRCNMTAADCARAAVATCNATAGCHSFGLSDNWEGLNKAKLFAARSEGLVPNADWSMWVRSTAPQDAATEMAGSKSESSSSSSPSSPSSSSPYSSFSNSESYADMYQRAHMRGTHPAPLRLQPDGGCYLSIHTASSFSGPWQPYRQAYISPCGGNNPAPFFHPNGTLFITFTDQKMGMWRADSWQGPYSLVTQNACGGGEDPSLYFDSKGRFHCLFHRSPFGNPDIAIGHAYSLDGYTWYAASAPAANSTIAYERLGNVVHGKRERPHLYFNSRGQVSHLVTGVCIIPACDPLDNTTATTTTTTSSSRGGAADVDCSARTQYYHCDANSPGPGWFDRTYTLVQAVRGA